MRFVVVFLSPTHVWIVLGSDRFLSTYFSTHCLLITLLFNIKQCLLLNMLSSLGMSIRVNYCMLAYIRLSVRTDGDAVVLLGLLQ